MPTNGKILVVDDNATNRVVLARILEKAEYEVFCAQDGFEAITMTDQFEPDLILLDQMMPGRSGVEVCEILKSQEVTADVPVIFATAATAREQIMAAFRAGGCDYVTKPLQIEEVLARVAVHIRLRKTRQELRKQATQTESLAARLAETNLELAALSRIDALTHLLNRKSWGEAMTSEHERFERYSHRYSILMIDVDDFKAFNDTKGHQAGDSCLKQTAAAICEVCRRSDVAGRFGGEEFIILAAETGSADATILAERIRKAVLNLRIEHPASRTCDWVTVSIGVAQSESGSWDNVVKRADSALYAAKNAGRNTVRTDGCDHAPDAVSIDALDSAMAPSIGPVDASNRPRVMVVDDDPTCRMVCRATLERAGFAVDEAGDGDSAVAAIAGNPPDVVVLDVLMPQMDGLQCTRALKSNPVTEHIPIVLVSSLRGGDDVVAGLEAGAEDYVTKPIQTTEFVVRVETMSRLSRERRRLLHEYQRQGRQMRSLGRLVEFCHEVGTCSELRDILERTVRVVSELTHSRRVSIMLPNLSREKLRVEWASGMASEVTRIIEVDSTEGIAGKVFGSGEPMIVNEASQVEPGTSDYASDFFASVPLLSAPLKTGGKVLGVLNATERDGARPFGAHELEQIEVIARIAAAEIQDIFARDAHSQACDSIMIALATLAEHRDSDTGRHVDRVTRYSRTLAEKLRADDHYSDEITDEFLHSLDRAAPLHDIGKVAIPDDILLHPGALTEEQMDVMRGHAGIGGEMLRNLANDAPTVAFLSMAAQIATHHHERHDGNGYPMGLTGSDIPLAARIVSVADVYDALTTKRVYKDPVSHDKAVAIILEGSGTQFHPTIVEAFTDCDGEFRRLGRELGDASVLSQPSDRATNSAAATC